MSSSEVNGKYRPSENLMPKASFLSGLFTRLTIPDRNLIELQVDGVTRCLARLLAHLREQGHEAVVLGPQSGMVRPIETLLLVPQP